MKRNQGLAYWRVGLVFLIYGVLYLGGKGTLDVRMGAVLVPLYVLLRPADPRVIEAWPQVRQGGLLLYMIKWNALIFGLTAVALVGAAFYTGQDVLAFVKSVAAEPLYIASPIAAVFISWLTNDKHRKNHEMREVEAQKKKKRGKKRKA